MVRVVPEMNAQDVLEARRSLIEDFDGISPMHEVFYLEAVRYSGEATIRAISRFQALALPYLEHGPDFDGGDMAGIVSAVHEALNHCGGLSKVFWAPDKKDRLAQARSQKLRSAFALEDTSPLNNRELRNALEHFDERLDSFLVGYPIGMFFPAGLVAPHEVADEAPGQIFRMVDPWSRIFVIFNQKYPFHEVFLEADRVTSLAKKFMNNGGRLPRVNTLTPPDQSAPAP